MQALSNVAALPAPEVHTLLNDGNMTLIDVREAAELAECAIPGAVHAPLSAISPENLPPLEAGKRTVFFCKKGIRSEKAAHYIKTLYPEADIAHMEGGIESWVAAGLLTVCQGG